MLEKRKTQRRKNHLCLICSLKSLARWSKLSAKRLWSDIKYLRSDTKVANIKPIVKTAPILKTKRETIIFSVDQEPPRINLMSWYATKIPKITRRITATFTMYPTVLFSAFILTTSLFLNQPDNKKYNYYNNNSKHPVNRFLFHNITTNISQYIKFSKNRSLSPAEIRSEYLKHSLVINENNYLTYYAGNLTLNTSIDPSKWYHIAGTYNDNGEANLFLDGINVQSDYNGAKIKSNLYKAWIGSWNGLTNEFNGTIDNVAIYSRALTNQTIKAHFERGLKTYSLNRLRTTSTKNQWNKTIMTNLRVVW